MGGSVDALKSFDLELERVRLAAARVLALAGGREVAEVEARLAETEARLAETDRGRGLEYVIGLRPDEVLLMWSIVAATIDPELALHLPSLGPRYGKTGISLAQFATLGGLPPARNRALGRGLLAANPLVQHRLVEPIDPRTPTGETGWVATSRLISFLAGEDELDPVLVESGGLVAVPEAPVTDAALDAQRARIAELVAGAPCAIILQGARGSGRRTLARLAADRPVVALDLGRLPAKVPLGDALAALSREVVLRRGLPLIASADLDAARRELIRFVETCPTPVFLVAAATPTELELARPTFRFDIALPAPRTRAALWRRALGAEVVAEPELARAAQQFQLGPGGIAAAVTAARAAAAVRGGAVQGADLVEGVKATVQERMAGLARRHPATLGWDDIVLPGDIKHQVELLVSRVRNAYQVLETWGFQRHLPGAGVAALFSGPPGTGKTMLASVIARALGLELFRVDLAQITSKWIGETEKQLDRVFEAAETGHVMLLFDEADSLFAKRTEVKGATERYANLEVNFLLQRIETFAGVAILTTNMDGSLDPAFRRRLAAHIRFPHPDADERRELWQRLVPRAAPIAGALDFAALADEFPAFAGAQIRNALTCAAFLAAQHGGAIDQALLRRAATEEAHSMGRIVKS